MRHLTRLRALASDYDGFLIDLWGVVHDGVAPYPGAAECLAALRDAGKRTLLLSNAPRRVEVIRDALRHMGIGDAQYDHVLTSGEATFLALRDRPHPFHAALGRRMLHIGPARDRSVFAGLAFEPAASPEEAEFVLNTGPDDEGGALSLDAFEPLLSRCAALDLPMLCANPDLEVIRGGERIICAGLLAQRYEELGGRVHTIGKPHPAIYEIALGALRLPAARVLAIGDSLRTDVAGAAAAGMDACWILGGIHAEALGGDPAAAEDAAKQAGLAPVACLPRFVW